MSFTDLTRFEKNSNRPTLNPNNIHFGMSQSVWKRMFYSFYKNPSRFAVSFSEYIFFMIAGCQTQTRNDDRNTIWLSRFSFYIWKYEKSNKRKRDSFYECSAIYSLIHEEIERNVWKNKSNIQSTTHIPADGHIIYVFFIRWFDCSTKKKLIRLMNVM